MNSIANGSPKLQPANHSNTDVVNSATAPSNPDAPPDIGPTPHPELEPQSSVDKCPPEIECKSPDLSVVRLIEKADHSAGRLVNLLVKHFPCFRDEACFDGRKVRILKRAQIFVADLWAAFNGVGYGAFDDIGHLTIFAGKHTAV